jgi:hypothetical protein
MLLWFQVAHCPSKAAMVDISNAKTANKAPLILCSLHNMIQDRIKSGTVPLRLSGRSFSVTFTAIRNSSLSFALVSLEHLETHLRDAVRRTKKITG